MWSGSDHIPLGPGACHCLNLQLLHIVPNLQNRRHCGFHPASLVSARLSLKVVSGLEFQSLVRTSRDTGAAVESLFKTSTKPV